MSGEAARRFGDTALAEADLFLLAAELLGPPGEEPAFAMLAPAIAEGIALFERADVPEAGDLAMALERIGTCIDDEDVLPLRLEHRRLFDGRVACPVNETGYVRRDKGAILADIKGFYRAFGFDLVEETGEKADHMGCQLEFIAMLLVMGYEAERAGAEEPASVTHDALVSFGADHLGEWVRPSARVSPRGRATRPTSTSPASSAPCGSASLSATPSRCRARRGSLSETKALPTSAVTPSRASPERREWRRARAVPHTITDPGGPGWAITATMTRRGARSHAADSWRAWQVRAARCWRRGRWPGRSS